MQRAGVVGILGPACGVTSERIDGLEVVVDCGWVIIARTKIEIRFLIAAICPKLGALRSGITRNNRKREI